MVAFSSEVKNSCMFVYLHSTRGLMIFVSRQRIVFNHISVDDSAMAEALATTRARLEALTGQAELADKSLLVQPSPDHLRKILAAVSAATGFGAGAFSGSRSDVDDQEFFTRLLHLVAFSLDVPEPRLLDQINVAKLVGGSDPAAAHLLLQKLVEAASSGEARKRWTSGGSNMASTTPTLAPTLPQGPTPEKGVAPRPSITRTVKDSVRQRSWHERLRILPGFMVAESDTEAWAVREKLAGLVAQLEALVEDVVSAARLAALDVDTVCQMMKDEVFRWKFVSGSSATRSMSSYAYKHIRGHPSQMYDMGTEVGSGAFGSVRQAKHRQTHEMHAVKGIPKDKVSVHHCGGECCYRLWRGCI
jgi:hypothetical protein